MVKLKKNKNNILKAIVFTALFLIFVFSTITLPFLNKIYPNVYITGIYVGDLTKDEAIKKIDEIKINENITLVANDKDKKLDTSDFIEKIDKQKTIDRAYNLTNTGNLVLDTLNKIKYIFNPVDLSLSVNFDEQKINEAVTIIASGLGEKPVYPSATIKSGQATINAGNNGVELDEEKIINNIKKNISGNINETIEIRLKEIKVKLTQEQEEEYKVTIQKLIGKSLVLKLDFDEYTINDSELASFVSANNLFNQEKIKVKISDVARKVNRNPQDSVFIVQNGVVTEFTPSVDGVTVNEDKLIKEIENDLSKLIIEDSKSLSINIPVVKLEPKIKNENVNNLGIKELIGKGVSYYKGSIPNRIHNVNLAQSKFKGVLVPPDEVFSFNEILGDVSSLTGYKSAYVIKDGKTVLGDGGGVCQVSTTLFRAVLSAGLPIVERKPHSYRVGYYEQGFAPGLDATVFYPSTDFKFKNDTGNYILIQPTNDTSTLTLVFEIYGTDDGRIATTTKPVITSSIKPADDLYVDDPTLPAGTIKQIEHRAYGARVVFDYKVTRNGEELINQKFVSNYRPWQAVYLRGTGI